MYYKADCRIALTPEHYLLDSNNSREKSKTDFRVEFDPDQGGVDTGIVDCYQGNRERKSAAKEKAIQGIFAGSASVLESA
ncbi:hypothetical protein [Litorivivens sp.]|uniref:hypothetical protein n=1 Tax=Litorivivens sp. TaxID=2020868 RepID=UPI003563A51C